MEFKIPENKKLSVLISCLDWGLGHTTRCIPIIKELLNQDFEVTIAASQTQKKLLQAEITGVRYLHLKGYQIYYSKRPSLLWLTILMQIPKILRTIYHEKKKVKTWCNEQEIDVVFSDNRPGFRAKNVYSIYLTHQLNIQTGNSITSFLANWLHHCLIRQFNACWIPDGESSGLAGKLSHAGRSAFPVTYIGPLSRFKTLNLPRDKNITILLSGPEPQRTIFENLLLPQLNASQSNITLIRGLPGEPKLPAALNKPNLTVFNHLNASDLNELICRSAVVISRSGYTTVMDLVKVGARGILVPTPGQGEQIYLAKYLEEKKYFKSAFQHNFSLSCSVDELKEIKFNTPVLDFESHKLFISGLREKLTTKEHIP